jgi:hypothetical protein
VEWQASLGRLHCEGNGFRMGREFLLIKRLGWCVLVAALPVGGLGQTALRAAVPPPVNEVFSPGPAGPLEVKPDPIRTYRDPVYRVAFDFPSNWRLSRQDGEISTFHLDARTASRKAVLRSVVAIPENPFPASTFSGAYVYFSVMPREGAGSCSKQAAGETTVAGKPPVVKKPSKMEIAGVSFSHGHDEQKEICITQRDEIYTTYRRGACYRFDLAMNNFCGGEVSGVKDVTAKELEDVRQRLEAILGTVRFEGK